MIELRTPISLEAVRELRVGEMVSLSGLAVTARDAAHKYMVERLIERRQPLDEADARVHRELREVLRGGAVYHCGPIVRREGERWRFVSAGPTTSIREEVYQDRVIAHFGLRVVIGKGGMGPRTRRACQEHGCVYLHGLGGTGALTAEAVAEVLDVFKLEAFGPPEAFWKIRFEGFVGVVTMDAHGQSLHDQVAERAAQKLAALTGTS
ncbi:fumarate hydratase C-terminal domain-containing protein [Limnochorda pilosa]|uniref:Fumarate hydratase, class I n=1 Tax=Limnochorda pilosa TaxID=1555112 RepID=A0A0K2SK08_LIMPI|nr:fumarate hydratase C-terminal domain-containing protein [Limnochorda pilosa]BAS27159.1 fumarate hydratase, class I [Limnochorda pilosa]